jgi:hypothetical protein
MQIKVNLEIENPGMLLIAALKRDVVEGLHRVTGCRADGVSGRRTLYLPLLKVGAPSAALAARPQLPDRPER